MIIVTHTTFNPLEFEDMHKCYDYIVGRAQGLKKSLRLVEEDMEHLTIRCPISGEYIDVLGTPYELEWVNQMLKLMKWYRPN